MNYLNTVFVAVKKECGKDGKSNDPECFKTISKETGVQPHRLLFYLDTLESIGLIRYNIDQGIIKLTEYGKLKESASTA